MPRKLAGYILLSFLSFCFFTVILNVVAVAQASAQQPTPPVIQPEVANPTPTIYEAALSPVIKHTTDIASPTPTIFQQQQGQSAVKQSAPVIQPTETPVPPTATPIPTDIPTATPTPSPEPTITTTTDLETLFSKYSAQYSTSKDELEKIAQCESGKNPTSTSSTGLYSGMFQFSATTWASVRGLMGLDGSPDLRNNAEESIKTAAFMLSRGEQNAWPNCN